jgi:hypothetical protein
MWAIRSTSILDDLGRLGVEGKTIGLADGELSG